MKNQKVYWRFSSYQISSVDWWENQEPNSFHSFIFFPGWRKHFKNAQKWQCHSWKKENKFTVGPSSKQILMFWWKLWSARPAWHPRLSSLWLWNVLIQCVLTNKRRWITSCPMVCGGTLEQQIFGPKQIETWANVQGCLLSLPFAARITCNLQLGDWFSLSRSRQA